MKNQKPPFEITNHMIDHVAEIAELVGEPYMVLWPSSRTPFPWSR